MNPLDFITANGKAADDWLSPILVKELRQGMRARIFVISFLLLQMFLVVLVLGNLAAHNDINTLHYQDYLFWVIIGFALLVLMPLRGLVAISQEAKNRTMETIMLTRLTAWRVVFGKWSALFAQSLLLVSAVLPYVVLRYFIGGEDVVSDFESMLVMLWFSGILIATTIAISGLGSVILRVIVLIGLIIATSTALGGYGSGGLDWEKPWEVLGCLVIFGLFVPALLFELTATAIAPVSENHAIRRRLLAVSFFLITCALSALSQASLEPVVFLPLAVLIGICYFDLAEKPQLVPRMVQSFGQKGFLGRAAAFFLLPGWPSALLFSLVVIPSGMELAFRFNPVPADDVFGGTALIFAVFGSVLVPITICHLIWTRMNHVLLMVFLYNVVTLAISMVLEAFASLLHSNLDLVFAFLPGLPVYSVARNAESETFKSYAVLYVMGNGAVLLLLVAVLLLSTRKYFREVTAIFRSTQNDK